MSQCYSSIIDQGISAPGHGKEFVDGRNDVDKRYIYKLISTVKLPETYRFDSQIQMQTGNQKDDVSLVKEFQHYLTKEYCKNSVFYQGGNNKRFVEIKWTDRQYHFQNNADVAHQYVIMYCNTNQFPELPFCVPYYKPHGARGWVSIIICALIQN